MKQKLKKILLLYLFTGTLFVSCSIEEDYVKNEHQGKLVLKKMYKDEIKKK